LKLATPATNQEDKGPDREAAGALYGAAARAWLGGGGNARATLLPLNEVGMASPGASDQMPHETRPCIAMGLVVVAAGLPRAVTAGHRAVVSR